jgi:hypothetical protein
MNLPPELWLKISQYLNRTDLKALFKINKRFHQLLRSVLYRNVVVSLNSIQNFCVFIASSAVREDGSNEIYQKLLTDLSAETDQSKETHHDLSTLQEILFMIQNPESDLNNLLERITEPLADDDVEHTYQLQLNPMYNHGYGKLVKSLAIPSDGFNVKLLRVLAFLPNLKNITFFHPPHDEKWIPFLKPKVLDSIASNFQTLKSLVIEDLSRIIWKPLINMLSQFGSCLLHLTIEASGELEPFFTTTGVLKVLAKNLPNLKALRLDGIPAGNDDSVVDLVTKCQKLECIILDYCFGITMECFPLIWNRLSNLKFLGFAGLNGMLTPYLVKKQDQLKTLRFVDCAVSDELV